MLGEKVRRPRSEVLKFVELLHEEMPPGTNWYLGGSWRRGALTVGDLNVLVVLDDVPGFYRTIDEFSLPKSFVAQRRAPMIVQGDLVLDGDVIRVDFWFCKKSVSGAALMFITGPPELNTAQAELARKKGMELSPTGLRRQGMFKDWYMDSEHEVYQALGMAWLGPHERQAFAPSEQNVVQRYVKSSKSDKRYKVLVSRTEASCECPGYQYRGYCKHVDGIRKELGITGPMISAPVK